MNAANRLVLSGLAALPLLGAAPAPLDVPRYIVKNARPDVNEVLIWKDETAHSRAASLILNGVNKSHPGMIDTLLACVVPNGTKVMLDSPGIFSHDVTVIDGKDAGCQGNIASNDLQRAP